MIDKFNAAIEVFRTKGHTWPKSEIQGSKLSELGSMVAYEQFENWLFSTQPIFDGLYTKPERT